MKRIKLKLAFLGVSLLTFVSLIGCKQAKAQKEDLGPEYTGKQISAVLAKASQGANFDHISVGQYIEMTHTRRIENAETVIDLGSRRVDVLDREDTANQAHFTLRISETQRADTGRFVSKVTEDNLWLRKSDAGTTQSPTVAPVTPANLTVESLLAHASAAQKKVTFHHLQESDGTAPAPDAIKSRADCGGLSPCELKLHYVQFEMAIWQDSSNYQKVSFDFGFNLNTPFLPYGTDFEQLNGVLVTDCRSTYVSVQSRTVYVRDCFDVSDFKK